MKKSINGKIYNTETAELICRNSRGSYPGSGNFSDWSSKLYRTKKGNFFEVGKGGGATRFAESCAGGGTCGNSNVFIVLTRDEALSFCESAGLDADKIAKFFAIIEA